MFPHPDIHNYTWTSPDGKNHDQIYHIFIDKKWHSSILDVQSFRRADCDTYHYLVVAKVREEFLISNFRRVLHVVCFLLGNSPASEFCMPMFQNTLSVPSS